MDALAEYVAAARRAGELVVQPRMGFTTLARMRAGLEAVRAVPGRTVGTVTVDSFTRVNDHAAPARALARGTELNGFPLVNHGSRATRDLVADLQEAGFPIQVRHGSALPWSILAVLLDAGITATEGGPVSYCLPYGRLPIRQAVDGWARGVELCASGAPDGFHLESFGGCLLGQLCPPGLLVAVAILEGLFFREHGITSISFGYTQQSSFEQDAEALAALRLLAAQLLPDVTWHVVLYTFMGLFPRTPSGARELLGQSVRLALRSGSERLIVKTSAESVGIPAVEQNVEALTYAARLAASLRGQDAAAPPPGFAERAEEIRREALALIEATLELSEDVGEALARAVLRGYLDVPFCLHPDNAKLARSALSPDGRVEWVGYGKLPIPRAAPRHRPAEPSSDELLRMLAYNRRRFDAAGAGPP